jgi:16S rRNA (guanine527-N7)-methyltransferase
VKELFTSGLDKLGIPCSGRQLDTLICFYNELSVWNKKSGFIKAEGRDLVIRHFFDSLAGVKLLSGMDFDTAADIGTGAGFPGVPLSIFFPDKKFTLVERSAKKSDFLNNCRVLFSLDNVDIAETELENIDEKFDLVTFRAFRNFNEYYKKLFSILPESGSIFAYKGIRENIEKELDEAGIELYKIHKVDVPFMTEERHILIIKKADLFPS